MRFVIKNSSNYFELPFERLNLTDELNKGVDGSLTMSHEAFRRYTEALNTTPDDALVSRPMEWYLYKGDVKIYGGILTRRSLMGGSDKHTYTLYFAGFDVLLNKRRTGAYLFYNEDSADIVNDLLNYTNSISPTGISMGLKPTTKKRQLTSRYANIRDEIVSMSKLKKHDGYDWDVDVAKKLNIYYPKGQTRDNIVLNDFNIIKYSFTTELQGSLTNKVYVLGMGFADTQAVSSVEDTTSQTKWGLLEDVLKESGVSDVNELSDRGTKFLNNRKEPTEAVSITHLDDNPDITSYNVGDTLPVEISLINFSKSLRIIKRTLRVTYQGNTEVTLGFEQ